MMNLYLSIILICYLIMAATWIATAFSTKKTIKKSGGSILRLAFYLIILFFACLQLISPLLATNLWPKNSLIYIIADIITVLGLIIMLWARKSLGKNWSANIVLKENHKLITKGPYKYVRHPIYSGLILMILGTVIYINTLAFLIFFIIFFLGAFYKTQKEEELLFNNFSNKYLEYKKHTKYLIPLIF